MWFNIIKKNILLLKADVVIFFKKINVNIFNIYKCLWVIDRVTIGILLLLIGISSLELISSLQLLEWRMCRDVFFFKKHLIFLVIFIIGVLFISQQSFEVNVFLSAFMGFVSIILCLMVLIVGKKINGAYRWFNFLGLSIQPSVFLKNTIGIFLPFLFRDMGKHIIFVGFCALLVVIEPDVGMTLLIVGICLTQIIIIYENLSQYIWWAVSALAAFGVFLLVKGKYLILRISKFFSGTGLYQSNVALINMKRTSLFGQNHNIPIPDSHCDFIFASITSHYGLMMGLFIIFLFLLFFVRNMQKALHLPFYQRIVIYGILAQISFQSLLHLASNLSFIPPKGVSLPFLSFGGSELMASIISIGTLLSLTSKKI